MVFLRCPYPPTKMQVGELVGIDAIMSGCEWWGVCVGGRRGHVAEREKRTTCKEIIDSELVESNVILMSHRVVPVWCLARAKGSDPSFSLIFVSVGTYRRTSTVPTSQEDVEESRSRTLPQPLSTVYPGSRLVNFPSCLDVISPSLPAG
jgi:hypothetical protein